MKDYVVSFSVLELDCIDHIEVTAASFGEAIEQAYEYLKEIAIQHCDGWRWEDCDLCIYFYDERIGREITETFHYENAYEAHEVKQ